MDIHLAKTLKFVAVQWFALALPGSACAQVTNNNIANRLALTLDAAPTFSSTNLSNVEWGCISKVLTDKCLQYHNDQWFSFEVPSAGKYYLNIADQECQKGYGVQAVVIEGNPCELKTYRILRCIPKIRDWDVYIELDSIQPNTRYLVNIDGFLGDLCNFNIQLSTMPFGVSNDSKNSESVALSHLRKGRIVTLQWNASALVGVDLISFDIFRTTGGRTKRLRRIPVAANTVGSWQTRYSIVDTLPTGGAYQYEILGRNHSGASQILDQISIEDDWPLTIEHSQNIELQLDYKQGTMLQIVLIDALQDSILKQNTFAFNKKKDRNLRMNVSLEVAKGIKRFTVRVMSLNTRQVLIHEFVVSPEGMITLDK